MKKKSLLSCIHLDKDGNQILKPDNGNHRIHVNFYLGKITANKVNYFAHMTEIEYSNSLVCAGMWGGRTKRKNGIENIYTRIDDYVRGKRGLKDWLDVNIADDKRTLKRVREEIADYWVDNSKIIRGNDITFDVKTFSKDSNSDPFMIGLKRHIRNQAGSCRYDDDSRAIYDYHRGIMKGDLIPLEKRDLDYVRNGINSTKPNKIERLRRQNILMQYRLAGALI